MTELERMHFAANLRRLMAQRELTPRSLCWLLGFGPERMQTIYMWLNGEVAPQRKSIRRLCAALRCEECELTGRDQP